MTITVARLAARVLNGLRRAAAGLPPSQEAVWPGVRNDLFVAHESVYLFASRFVFGRRVLDAACGTGYGTHRLARAGAVTAVGIDLDRKRIAFARRRYRAPNLEFRLGDCASLDFPVGSLDLIVSSNTLEHLSDPARFLRSAVRVLRPGGELLVTVPPVLSEADLEAHSVNPWHRSPLSVRAWADLFTDHGWSWRFFTHRAHRAVDLSSPFPSKLSPDDFTFVESSLESAYARAPLSATFLLQPAG